MEEIKKCPFCGATPDVYLWDKDNDLWYVGCTRYYCDNPKDIIGRQKSVAIKGWNDYVAETERKMNIDKKDSDERR